MTSEALLECITTYPDICHGKPCIRHLRYPVEIILELLSRGMTFDEILADYDDLEYEDIQAALRMVAQCVQAVEQRLNGSEEHKRLKEAANLLLDDYKEDKALTSFTALDGEPFYAQG